MRAWLATLLAAATLIAAGALVLPSSAHAHPPDGVRTLLGLRAGQPVPRSARIPTRAQLRADRSLRDLRNTKLRCRRTVNVPSQGPSCRVRGGVWRVNVPGGSIITHGPDAYAPMRAHHFAMKQRLVQDRRLSRSLATPDKTDIVCVADPATERHFRIMYVYPSDGVDNSATVVPQLRTEIYHLSAFMSAEAQALQPGATRKLKVACDLDGEVHIDVAQTATASAADSFSTIYTDLGTLNSWPAGQVTNLLGYYDGYDAAFAASGQGNWPIDESPDTSNSVNDGGRLALQYNYMGTYPPDWTTLLHEAGHNMGAVQNLAPDSSGEAHCNDGQDIMCYDDNGNTGPYIPNVCAVLAFDCDHDSYFHPQPAGGSYLANHWNLAHPNNLFVQAMNSGDTEDPTTPTNLTVGNPDTTSLDLTWTASTDNVGVINYQIFRRQPNGTMAQIATSATASYTNTGLTQGTQYTYMVKASDGYNVSAGSATATGRTSDAEAPSVPTAMAVSATTSSTATITFGASTDNVGVAGYAVLGWNDVANRWDPTGASGNAASRSLTVTGLNADSDYFYFIQAHDAAGNVSWGAQSVYAHTLAADTTGGGGDTTDTTDPTRPGRPTLVSRSRRTIRFRWPRSTDTGGAIDSYAAFVYQGGRWVEIGTTSSPSFRAYGLRPGRRYRFTVQAIDASGNRSARSPVARFKTRR